MNPSFDVLSAPIDEINLLEASAGTGKTFSIVHLIVRMIVEEQRSIDEILIVTFTKDATTELKERLLAKLVQIRDSIESGHFTDDINRAQFARWCDQSALAMDPQTIASRIKSAINNYENANIFTIHSFCQKALQEGVFSGAGLYNLEFLDNDSELIDEAIDGFIREHVDSLETLDLQKRFLSSNALEQKIRRLAQNPPALRRFSCQIHLGDDVLVDVDEKSVYGDSDPLAALIQKLLIEVPERFIALKKEAGYLTYDDMLVEMYEKVHASSDLRQRLRETYKGVLIDEFQDTDPIQWGIFKALFMPEMSEGNAAFDFLATRSLIFVGDPKQAIYSFRNADLKTYLDAKASIEALERKRQTRLGEARAYISTLNVNFRSSKGLVDLVNDVFKAPEAFLNPGLTYHPVSSHKGEVYLMLDGKALPSATFWTLKKALGVKDMIQESVALSIKETIELARAGRLLVAQGKECPRSVTENDIAILVNTNNEAMDYARVLSRYHIRSRVSCAQSVFSTDEAQELLRVLRAIASPENRHAVNVARTTLILGETLRDFSLENNTLLKNRQRFEATYETWHSRGIAKALFALFETLSLSTRLLRLPDGTRRLTNLYHLVETLHLEGKKHDTPQSLLLWFEEQVSQSQDNVENEALQVRPDIESDVVTIQTIHKAKGLEYPIVYLPTAYSMRDKKKSAEGIYRIAEDEASAFHYAFSYSGTLDMPEAIIKAAQEESARLAYVAMTRASVRMIIVIPKDINNIAEPIKVFTDKDQADPVKFAKKKEETEEKYRTKMSSNAYPYTRLFSHLRDLLEPLSGRLSNDRLTVESIENIAPSICPTPLKALEEATPLHANTPPEIYPDWKMSSFSALSNAMLSLGADDLDPGLKRSAADEPSLPQDDTQESPEVVQSPAPLGLAPNNEDILFFPAGAMPGEVLHKIFEDLDFTKVNDPEFDLEDFCEAHLRNFNLMLEADEALNAARLKAVVKMVRDVLTTPLTKDLRLEDVPLASRQSEFEFLMSSDFEPEALHRFFAEHAPEYPMGAIDQKTMRGFILGFMDLVFFAHGKYWILDWKSNRLGQAIDDYDRDSIQASMTEHHYFLQYLIYTVALKRFLTARFKNFDYERDFGGVFYVYLRGIRATHVDETGGASRGLFFDKPSKALIEAFDQFLSQKESD